MHQRFFNLSSLTNNTSEVEKIMIAIDNMLVSDEVVEEQFVCDLTKCKGGCCEDGDAGAPLETEELNELLNAYAIIKEYMSPRA